MAKNTVEMTSSENIKSNLSIFEFDAESIIGKPSLIASHLSRIDA